jgi:hypothetical protein
VDEAIRIKEEKSDVEVTTATLAGVDARPEVRAAAASTFGVGGASSAGAATAPAIDEQAAPLFSPEEAKDFRTRWDTIQVSFVDDPRLVVGQADSLVAVAMKRLAERTKLESQWDRGDNISNIYSARSHCQPKF